MTNSRIRRKKRRQSAMVYDGNSLPLGMTFRSVLDFSRRDGVILYSTVNGGHKPVIWPKKNTKYYKFREVSII